MTNRQETHTFEIYAHGTFWGEWTAQSAEDAIQIAADEIGTVDVGQTEASTDGLYAIQIA